MRYEGLKRVVADRLFELGAVLSRASSKDGRLVKAGEQADGKGFLLKLHEQHPDFPLSPFYFNLRTPDNPKPGPLDDQVLDLIGQLVDEAAVAAGFRLDAVVGVPNAGDPFARAAVRYMNRRGSESHWVQLKKVEVEGKRLVVLPPGFTAQPHLSRLVIIDDVVTSWKSKIETREALRQGGFSVQGLIVLIDRRSSGARGPKGLVWRAIYAAADLFAYYGAQGRVSSEDVQAVNDFLKVPLPEE